MIAARWPRVSSWARRRSRRSAETRRPILAGEAGALRITGAHPGGFQVANLRLETDLAAARAPEPVAPELKGGPANVAEVYAQLARDIRSGERTVADFQRAVRLTRLLDAVDAASATGRRQTLSAS